MADKRWYDGTALGCIGRCKVCGKAIQLRRIVFVFYESDIWVHFTEADHPAVLNPGVCDAPPEDEENDDA